MLVSRAPLAAESISALARPNATPGKCDSPASYQALISVNDGAVVAAARLRLAAIGKSCSDADARAIATGLIPP